MVYTNYVCNGKPFITDDNVKWAEEVVNQRNYLDVCWSLLTFNVTDDTIGMSVGNGWINKLKKKVLVLHGEKDLVVPLDKIKQWKKLLGDKAVEKIYENASHCLLVDVLDDFATTILEFILESQDFSI